MGISKTTQGSQISLSHTEERRRSRKVRMIFTLKKRPRNIGKRQQLIIVQEATIMQPSTSVVSQKCCSGQIALVLSLPVKTIFWFLLRKPLAKFLQKYVQPLFFLTHTIRWSKVFTVPPLLMRFMKNQSSSPNGFSLKHPSMHTLT